MKCSMVQGYKHTFRRLECGTVVVAVRDAGCGVRDVPKESLSPQFPREEPKTCPVATK